MISLKLDRGIVLPGDEVSGVCCVRGCDGVVVAGSAPFALNVFVRGVHLQSTSSTPSLILSGAGRAHLAITANAMCVDLNRVAQLVFRFTCRLPLSLAPSHRGANHRVDYTVAVEVVSLDQVLARVQESFVVVQAPPEFDCDLSVARWSILCTGSVCRY